MRLVQQKNLSNVLPNHLMYYPTSSNTNYLWSFGSLSGIFLVIQIVTGVLLAMHYTPHILLAFLSVEHIARDVNFGWLMRYMHANGASFFFIVAYIHIGRNLFFKTYNFPRLMLWSSGIILFLLMMATAFLGYVLPWGQMSFWAATVITNLFTAIPVVGKSAAQWLWGGYAVDNPTLNRFFSLHYLLPFLLSGLALVHLNLLHVTGSTNPTGAYKNLDKISFYPYFYIKDLFILLVTLFIFSYFVFFNPNFLGHPDNYIPANSLVTPAHLVPEWYFLPFYAILRSIPSKVGGLICMVLAIAVFFIIGLLDKGGSRLQTYSVISSSLSFLYFVNFGLLLWLGGKPVELPYTLLAQVLVCLNFTYVFIILPGVSLLQQSVFEDLA
jgi:ubiquinol-cytochrome c reductase cytochrome b/c1 subunit